MNDHIAAVGRVQAALPAIGKDAQSQAQGKYSYRSIDGLINALHPVMAAEGLVIAPVAQEIVSDSGQRMVLRVTYRVMSTAPDAEGEPLEIIGLGIGMGNDDKGPGKALSYAFKSTVSQLFTVPTQDASMDPDHADPPQAPSEWWGGWKTQEDHDRDREILLDESKALTQQWRDVIRGELLDHGIIDNSGRWAERITVNQAGEWDELLRRVDKMQQEEPFDA